MGWISAIAIFFIIWWTSLFVILPLGNRSQIENDHVTLGTEHGAPSESRIGRKFMQTTMLASVVFVVFYLVTQVWGLSPDDFPRFIPGS